MENESEKEFEDSTSESLNYDAQLLATQHNKFSHLSNPTAEPPLIFMSHKHGKVIRKSSSKSASNYSAYKRIRGLIRKFEYNPCIEEQVVVIVQRALDMGGLSSKKLDAIVAAALYLVHRQNHSQILLSQILNIFKNTRSSEISKCLNIFKQIGLYEEVDILQPWTIFMQLLDQWFPYHIKEEQKFKMDISLKKEDDSDFSITPMSINFGKPPVKILEESQRSERDQMMEIGKLIDELPEITQAKQGKLPQTFAAGVFMVTAKYCGYKIQQTDIAKKLNICTSTVAQSKRGVMEVLWKKVKTGDAAEKKWDRIVGLIESLKADTKK